MTLIATLDIDLERRLNLHSSVSFAPFVRFLKEKSKSVNKVKRGIYEFIIEKFEAHPELLVPFSDTSVLDQHIDLINMLEILLGSMVNEETIMAFGFPFDSKLFHYPEAFNTKFARDENGMIMLPVNKPVDELYNDRVNYIYKHILYTFYKIEVTLPDYMVFTLPEPNTGLLKYYKAFIDSRFVDIKYNGTKLPDVGKINTCTIQDETNRTPNLQKLKEELPLEDFLIEGFCIIRIEDFTEEECLTELKNIIINISKLSVNDYYPSMATIVQNILGVKINTVNFFPLLKVNDHFIKSEEYYFSEDIKETFVIQNTFFDFIRGVNAYVDDPKSIFLPVCTKEAVANYPILYPVLNSMVGSYLLQPVFHHHKLVGLIEIATSKSESLDLEVLMKMEEIVPLVAQIFNYQIEKFEDSIEKLIREQFTAIQSSVEWKFNEVAWNYIKDNNTDNKTIGNIVFENVYPLYGALDIRNSSVERNIAIQKDFVEQLFTIGTAIKELQTKIELPLLEGLYFKNEHLLNSTKEKLSSEDEIRLDTYFEEEVIPLFTHLSKTNGDAKTILNKHYHSVNRLNGQVYHFRKEYEDSLNKINAVVNNYLNGEKDKIQLAYPNYFEKYKTDGVEYNIYIGQSIAPNLLFNPIYLKNLHLWQLTSMIELAKLTRQLLPTLEVPLQTTQLILVHNTPIDISFRKDEKRFDTEGAYNLRYEIMKKRIDKSHVKNTNERLTQPDKIAIVYSNTKDTEEYMSYIEFLQNKGSLLPEVEHLELEELQGVYGLKALRVGVNYN